MDKSPEAFRTISEAAEQVGVPTHVLRFWESRFTQVKPVKRAGGRRYYRPQDVDLLVRIRALLHDEGMTIRGVQKLLREGQVRPRTAATAPVEPQAAPRVQPLVEADEAPMMADAEPEPEAAPVVLSFLRSAPSPAPLVAPEPETMPEPAQADTAEVQAGAQPTEPEPSDEPRDEPATPRTEALRAIHARLTALAARMDSQGDAHRGGAA